MKVNEIILLCVKYYIYAAPVGGRDGQLFYLDASLLSYSAFVSYVLISSTSLITYELYADICSDI